MSAMVSLFNTKLYPGLVLTLGLLLLLPGRAQAQPKDWLESDWAKFFEMAVLVTVDAAHGGVEGIAGYAPVAGRIPLVDAYSALSAAGSTVKPALIAWLNKKIYAAQVAGDYESEDRYQAHLTAVSIGDPGPIIAWQTKKNAEREKATRKKAAETLVLHTVLADADDRGLVEINPQFTVNTFENETIRYVTYKGTLTGPKTTIPVSGTLESTKGSGHQASLFRASLPEAAPNGQYTATLQLRDSRGVQSEQRQGSFAFRRAGTKPPIAVVPPETKEPPEQPETGPTPDAEKPPETTVTPPPVDKPPVPPTKTTPPVSVVPPNPPTQTPPPATQPKPFTVSISGPTTTKVGNGATFSPVLSGEPVGPVDYTWTIKGRTLKKHTIRGRFDDPGSRLVGLVATDAAGRKMSAQLRVQVEENDLRVQVSGPGRTPISHRNTLSSRVTGGTPPYTYEWVTDGRRWKTQNVTCDYDTPGVHQATLTVRDIHGAIGRGSLQIQVDDGLAINVAGPRAVKLGESAAFTPVVVTGPKSGYTYSWEVEGQTSTGPTFSPVFQTTGRKTLIMRANHPNYPPFAGTRYIFVEDDSPLKVRIVGPNRAETGEQVSFRPAVSGGVPPYRYTWVVKGKKVSKESISGRFEKPGQHSVLLYVSDATKSGEPSQGSLSLNVTESDEDKATDMKVSIESPTHVKVDEGVQFSPQVSGGTPPYRYRWTVKGKTLEKESVRGRFEKTGDQQVSLAVFDSGEHRERPVLVSTTVSVGNTAASVPTQARVREQGPVTIQEFAGIYTWSYLGSKRLGDYGAKLFLKNGIFGDLDNRGQLSKKGRYSLRGGVLTIKRDAADYSLFGPVKRLKDSSDGGKSFFWESREKIDDKSWDITLTERVDLRR